VLQEMGWLRERCRRAAGPGAIDVDQLIEAQRYELNLRAQQRQLEQQRQAVAAEIERRRQALVAANRDVRVLEKLRDKQAVRHQQDENRRDIKLLDEVAQQRAAREVVG
jgi:flagellar export protein FliJ